MKEPWLPGGQRKGRVCWLRDGVTGQQPSQSDTYGTITILNIDSARQYKDLAPTSGVT